MEEGQDVTQATTTTTRPHVPHIPSAPFSENSELELIWGRMNGFDEALTTLQHGHNLLASALEELKGRHSVVATPE
jgi:hypothetical protein